MEKKVKRKRIEERNSKAKGEGLAMFSSALPMQTFIFSRHRRS